MRILLLGEMNKCYVIFNSFIFMYMVDEVRFNWKEMSILFKKFIFF